MNAKWLVAVVVAWILLTLYNYYYGNFFFIALEEVVLSSGFAIVCIYQLVRIFVERKSLGALRIVKLVVFVGLFLLTYYRWWTFEVIEKADWAILGGQRMTMAEQIQSGKLKLEHEGGLWKLPFHFLPLSNGGNDIFVKRNTQNDKWIIAFVVFANFFDAPSIYRVYTDDPLEIQYLDRKAIEYPAENWKLAPNWYRIVAEYPW